MRIWLMKIGEPLPVDPGGPRLLRSTLLAEQLIERGHEVTWWTADYNHPAKSPRTGTNTRLNPRPGLTIELLRGPSYQRNLSLKRILHHRSVAREFRSLAAAAPRPDAILCSLPILEFCAEAVRYALPRSVPVAIDVRDLWPDALVHLAPAPLRPLARLALRNAYRQVRYACSQATALCGITEGAVEFALNYGNRQRGPLDRVFPLGYSERIPAEDEQRQAAEFWASQGIRPDANEFLACYFGTLGPHFEFGTVIEAARRLATTHPRIRLVLCGRGPSLERLRKQAAGLPNICFPGWINAAQVWSLMQMASVGLAPYQTTFNYVPLVTNKPIEYLSAGLPVVTGLRGTLSELLTSQQCGVIYRNGDEADLARVLAQLADSPTDYRAMSLRARALYEQRFVAEQVYGEMADYLATLAGAEAPAASITRRAA